MSSHGHDSRGGKRLRSTGASTVDKDVSGSTGVEVIVVECECIAPEDEIPVRPRRGRPTRTFSELDDAPESNVA